MTPDRRNAQHVDGDLPAGKRRRVSILVEFLAALVSVVLISAAGTGVFEERMTRSALSSESQRLTLGALGVVHGAYESAEASLGFTLRELAERLNVSGYLDPDRLIELERLLASTGSTLAIDQLGVFAMDGRFIAGEGRFLEYDPAITTDVDPGFGPRLVPAPGVGYRRILTIRIGLDRGVLVGGLDFSDGVSHELRDSMGGSGQVILVAGGKVAGSSLELPEDLPPGLDPESGELPSTPAVVELNGDRMLVVYEPVAGFGASLPGAVGVAVSDPVEGLTQRLSAVRLLSTVVLAVTALTIGWLLFWSLVKPLVGLSRTAARIAGGDLSANFVAPRDNEIGRLADALQKMTQELKGQARSLQEASKRLLVAQQEERQRVARDLHDGMQQQLVVLAVKIKQLAASGLANPLRLEHLAAEAEEAAFALQDLGRGIFPTVLGDQGVAAAVRTSASRLPMEVRLEIAPEMDEKRFSPEVEGTLYFVTMEAMANAQKHAPDSRLNISVTNGEGEVILEISDDGPGFDPSQERLGSGLQNMADRVSAVGGTALITATPGRGVTILARIPLGLQDPGGDASS